MGDGEEVGVGVVAAHEIIVRLRSFSENRPSEPVTRTRKS